MTVKFRNPSNFGPIIRNELNMKKKLTTLLCSGAAGVLIMGGMPLLALAESDSVETNTSGTVEVRPVKANVRAEVKTNLRANADDWIEKAKERAHRELERRKEALEKLQDRIEDAKRLSEEGKNSLTADIRAQLGSLEALRTRIAASISTSTIRADIASITKSHRIFALVIPKGAILAAADRVKTIAARMTTLGAKSQVRIDATATAGIDVSAAKAALADFTAKVADAGVQVQAAIDLVATLKADNGDELTFKANKQMLKDAREKIRLAEADLKAAREDLRAILKELLKASTEASTETSASGSTE